jgi:hypothetical protein
MGAVIVPELVLNQKRIWPTLKERILSVMKNWPK